MTKHHKNINVLGYKMHYSVYGRGSPLLLIHGFGTDGYSWRNNVRGLSNHHKIYVPDLIGFGKSDKPEIIYSLSFFTRQIYRFLISLKINKATLVGASWGGGIALSFTLTSPERVDKLILIDSITPFSTTKLIKARKRRLKALVDIGEKKKSLVWGKRVLEDLLKESYYNKEVVTDNVVKKQFKLWKTAEGRNVLITAANQCKFNDIVAKIYKIDKNSLIIWGEKDPYFPLKSMKWLNSKLKYSKLVAIPNAGHAPHETHPDTVNQAILDFLRNS